MQTSALISSALATIAILISIGTFIYQNIRRGKLLFWPPESYHINLSRGRTNIAVACPVHITDTGSVVHTVNFIWGCLKQSEDLNFYPFRMQLEVDNISHPTKEVLASGFAVQPNGNTLKRLVFVSDVQNVPIMPGGYTFALYAWTNGKTPTSSHISFNFELDADDVSDINTGLGVVRFHHYELDCSRLRIDKRGD